jgi:hypothetical protein
VPTEWGPEGGGKSSRGNTLETREEQPDANNPKITAEIDLNFMCFLDFHDLTTVSHFQKEGGEMLGIDKAP